MTPLDALLAQLASSAIEVSRGAANLNFGHILAGMRDKYAQTMRLEPAVLAGEAAMTLAAVAACVAERMSAEDAQALYAELSLVERDAIEHKMAVRSVRDPQAAVAQGKFLSFAPGKTLLRLFQAHPDLFFDGKCWDDTYSELTYTPGPALEEARAQLVSYYASLLTDAIWLVEREPDDLAEASRERLLRADLALELIAPARGGGPVDR
jgi:hypothetical protein